MLLLSDHAKLKFYFEFVCLGKMATDHNDEMPKCEEKNNGGWSKGLAHTSIKTSKFIWHSPISEQSTFSERGMNYSQICL